MEKPAAQNQAVVGRFGAHAVISLGFPAASCQKVKTKQTKYPPKSGDCQDIALPKVEMDQFHVQLCSSLPFRLFFAVPPLLVQYLSPPILYSLFNIETSPPMVPHTQ